MDEKTPPGTIIIKLSEPQYTEFRVMCLLTRKTMSAFIRIAIRDKIKQLKENQEIENSKVNITNLL